MGFELVDINHALLRVANLADAVAAYRSFGFTIAPERRGAHVAATDSDGRAAAGHRAPFSARNILFQPFPGRDDIASFIVLQCIENQFGLPVGVAQSTSFLQDTEGLKALICHSEDLARTRDAMAAAGVETGVPPWMVEERFVDEERGIELPVRVEPCIPLARRMPFLINAFHSTTLESFRYPPWTIHENTTRYLAGATGVSNDFVAETAIMAETVFGVEPDWHGDDIAIVRPRDIELRIVTPAGFAELFPALDFSSERILPAYAAVTFAVESLATVRDVLARNGVEASETPQGTLAVPRSLAANTVLEFAEL